MDLTLFQERELPKFEKVLLEKINKNSHTHHTLAESMRYSLTAGGKRIRPLLLLAVMESMGTQLDDGYEVAAALEFIHTYSLIHDDLPAMDDDDLRRGKATNHIVFGEDIAILAGDGLLTQAFQIVAESQLTDAKKIKLIAALAKAAGPEGMVAGQAADLEGENQMLSLQELQAVHQKKTGELLKFAVYAGGVVSNAPDAALHLLLSFASHFGLAFQIRDDILDVIGDAEKLGKNTGMDEKQHKSTYPGLLTLEGSKKALSEELTAAKEDLTRLENLLSSQGENFQGQLLAQFIEWLSIE